MAASRRKRSARSSVARSATISARRRSFSAARRSRSERAWTRPVVHPQPSRSGCTARPPASWTGAAAEPAGAFTPRGEPPCAPPEKPVNSSTETSTSTTRTVRRTAIRRRERPELASPATVRGRTRGWRGGADGLGILLGSPRSLACGLRLAHDLELLERPARADRNARERRLGHRDRHLGLLAQPLVEP